MNKIQNKYLYFLIPLVIILWVVAINSFPSGYVYNSGDFAQPINIKLLFKDFIYTWNTRVASPGEGGYFQWFAAVPYYFIFYYVPALMGFSETFTLSYVLFLFLSLSYLSFYLCLRILFNKKDKLTVIFPLTYAINYTTLYFFTYTWGFSHHIFLYVTFPLLLALFYKFVTKPSMKIGYFFLVLLFVSISGFTNPAFFLAMVLYFTIFLLGLFLYKVVVIDRKLVVRLLLLGLFSLVVVGYWLYPTLFITKSQLISLKGGSMFNLETWLQMQSSSLLSLFSGLPGLIGFFPFKYGYLLLYPLPFASVFVLLYLLHLNKGNFKSKPNKLVLILLTIFIVFGVLIKKSEPPFGTQTLALFNIPIFTALRSYEKLAVLLPSVLLISTYILMGTIGEYKKKIMLTALIIICPLPFFIGGIQKRYSITMEAGTNYKTATYSGLVKIPDSYSDIILHVNKTPTNGRIMSLPYSAVNTDAWVNYPKWKLIGFSVLDNLFTKSTIAQNLPQIAASGFNMNIDLSNTKHDPIWYVRALKYLNVTHILYHLDVFEEFVQITKDKMGYLEKAGAISKAVSSKDAILYKLNNKYIGDLFYIPKKVVGIYGGLWSLPSVMLNEDGTNLVFVDLDNFPDSLKDKINTVYFGLKAIDSTADGYKDYLQEYGSCSDYCYYVQVPYSGKYRVLVSKDEINAFEGSVQDIYFDGVPLRYNGDNGTHFDFGNVQIDKSASHNVTLNINKTNHINQGWEKLYIESDFLSMLGKGYEIVGYKRIRSIGPGSSYTLSFEHKDNTRFGIGLIEVPDSKEEEGKVFYAGDPGTVSRVLFTNKLAGDAQGWKTKKVDFVSSFKDINNGYLVLFAQKGVQNNFVKNVKLETNYNPAIMLQMQKSDIRSNLPVVTATKVNPVRYKLDIADAKEPFFLVMSETNHAGWKVFNINKSGFVDTMLGNFTADDTHFVSNGFSNGWYLSSDDISEGVAVKYVPQEYMLLGLVTGLTLLVSGGIYLVARKKK